MRSARIADRSPVLVVLGLIILLAGCDKPRSCISPVSPAPVEPAGFAGTIAFEEVRQLVAIGPRPSGSPGAAKAADHIARRLADIGFYPAVDTFTNMTPAGRIAFRNITAILPGTRPGLVIIGSHYDTKPGIDEIFIGANDSGSSSGLLLALMQFYHKAHGDRPTIMAAFFDGEECRERYGNEDGLHGSKRLARQLAERPGAQPVLGVIVLDMVGDSNLSVTIPRNSSPPLIQAVFTAATAQGTRALFSLLPGGMVDDHLPFLEAGIPAIDLIDFNYGARPGGNEYWHTPQDTLDKVNPRSLEIVGRVTIGTINLLNAPIQNMTP